MASSFATHTLTRADVQRFSRQLLLKDFGQEKLRGASVLIVGAGGLGCPVASYLAASGIGRIGITDHDVVSLDNIHRQILHNEQSVGKLKVESVRDAILKINSGVAVEVHPVLLDSTNAKSICASYDIVVDCSDNVATRYLINDVCVLLGKPLVSGSALGWEGQLTVYNNGMECPCYRCIFPQPPPPDTVTNCSEGGVLGPITGMIGSLQALEVIKIAVNGSSSFSGKLYMFDGLEGRVRTITLRKRDKACAVCGESPSITELVDYEQFCGAGPTDKVKSLNELRDEQRISVYELKDTKWDSSALLIDVRPEHEFAICHLPNFKNVSLASLQKMSQVEAQSLLVNDVTQIVCLCHRGNDSQLAVKILNEKLDNKVECRDVKGGLQSWSTHVDPNFPRY